MARFTLAAVAVAALLIPTAGQAGGSPSLSWSPSTNGSFDYGAVTPGQTASQTFTLTNSGGSGTGMSSAALSGSTAFSITSDACTGTALGKGKSCAVTVQYAPTTAGQSDTATLTASSKKSATAASVKLTGHSVGVVPAIAAGLGHSCAVTSTGAAKCWGSNSGGQLGNGTTTNSSVPVDVSGLASGVTAISVGSNHSCAVTSAGAAKCWGSNSDGQLGNGTNTSSNVPVDVLGLASGVSAVSAGASYSCALTSAGAVKCWGDNFLGELGNGTNTNSNVPVDVSGLGSGVTSIAAGAFHICALTSAGAAKCWGNGGAGDLGNGTNTNSNVPVDVSGLASGVTAISAGGITAGHSCALTSAGAVKCWGNGGSGQLGDGTNMSSNVPADVSGLASGVTAISAGGNHSCAVTSAGAAKCWGFNPGGQLGNGTNTNSSVPVDVSGLASGVTAIAAGRFHSCALTSAGSAKCWGSNGTGQLGNGTTTDSNVPVDVLL